MTPTKGIFLTGEQLETYAGRQLTDEEVEQIGRCIPHSSIPSAIEAIANEAVSPTPTSRNYN